MSLLTKRILNMRVVAFENSNRIAVYRYHWTLFHRHTHTRSRSVSFEASDSYTLSLWDIAIFSSTFPPLNILTNYTRWLFPSRSDGMPSLVVLASYVTFLSLCSTQSSLVCTRIFVIIIVSSF